MMKFKYKAGFANIVNYGNLQAIVILTYCLFEEKQLIFCCNPVLLVYITQDFLFSKQIVLSSDVVTACFWDYEFNCSRLLYGP